VVFTAPWNWNIDSPLILALGSVTNFYNLPGLAERALTMKNLGEAVDLRNRLIAHLEEADTDCARDHREPLLTFIVAAGGFAGVETIAAVNDFLRQALPLYSNLKRGCSGWFWSTRAPPFFLSLAGYRRQTK
jgi:NADH dehydrogenase FAD-containing subunit